MNHTADETKTIAISKMKTSEQFIWKKFVFFLFWIFIIAN